MFKSTDSGATWSAISLTDIYIGALAIDPRLNRDPLTPASVYAGGQTFTAKRVFTSMDGGATWSAPSLTDFIWDLAIDPQTPTILYAGSGSGGYKSIDGGATWSAINTGLADVLLSFGAFPAVQALAIEPLMPTTDPNHSRCTNTNAQFRARARTKANTILFRTLS